MMSPIIAKGAEATLFLEELFGFQVIRKHRIPKSYRVRLLDTTLRHRRTIREARLLNAARRAGVPTPIVFSVNPETATIIMEYIEGNRLKEHLAELSTDSRQMTLGEIGRSVARLHKNHLSHGDLTTSNMILHPSGKVYFIDFGLAATTQTIEDFGTDIHLLRQALSSTHYLIWEECYRAFKEGYRSTFGRAAGKVFHKVDEIESRGRYIIERIR